MLASRLTMFFCIPVVLFAFSLPAAGQSANLLSNPGAEEVQANRPVGFGMYVGAGKMSLTASTESPHGGKTAAKLTFEDWYRAEGKPAQISGSLLFGGGNGYQPDGSLEAKEGSFGYAFEFRVRGDLGPARLSVWTWDAAGVRGSVPAGPNTVALTGEWRKVTGRFSLPAGTKHFALGLGVAGKQAEGAKLGRLEVDDASITPIGFPGGELRAMWSILDPKEGPAAIDERIKRFKAMKINAAFCWTTSLYIATAVGMEPGGDPTADWDAFGKMLRQAHEAGIQIHVWYSPWIYKQSNRGIELRRHPEWAAVNAKGKRDGDGICLARPEVREFQLELLRKFVDRYPAIDGIHIEEPGYNWGDYCYCDYCKKTFKELFGIELKPGENVEARHNWAAFCSTDFTARLREQLVRRKPGAMLSANGSAGANPDWYLGRDWTTWARRGYIDFYVPQIYTESVDSFRESLKATQRHGEPSCRIVPGMAITWSGIHPRRNTTETILGEITAARKGGAPGFVIFHAACANEEDVKAIGGATK